MIRAIDDPAVVNGFANHPDIRPHLGSTGTLDLTPGFKPGNLFLFGAHGGFTFAWSAPETYEVHVMLTKAGRGRWGVQAWREAVQMIEGHLWARIHPQRPEVAAYARLCGFNDTGATHQLDVGDGPVCWRIFNRRA